MPSALDAEWHNITFSALILRLILDNPLEGETPQSRLKQIGMMSVLYYMHQANRPLTIMNIVEFTALTRGGVTEAIDQLVRRKIVTESIVRNSMGRGQARELKISPDIFKRLRALQAG
ncbi:MAG TPA: MarR family transcriptional regulator [Xanthobacteraceae bacterium]|jgi:DNA-binding MarR family transcriptional regulator|nr:MAG: MarR family transcriptional regulator [Rhizobiales bacterium 35-66-30]OZA97410.1 MAG: MarR family transcriptional regulator [Rhizobiales bacterium 39-66-18]HQS49944.1 MarR family transcriptional regulator [Xanthobacteraceae bacterium]